MKEPIWIEEELTVTIHKRQISEHGGFDGIRDNGLLLSALARPKHLYNYEEATIAQLAASYAYGIARNHPFLDGNKRTALVVCRTFLRINNYDLKATNEDKYLTFLSLASGYITEEELAKWISENTASMERKN